jgi:hypothetical protein
VPQIWLTYDELAVLLNRDAADARAAAAAIPLDRRRSRDGQVRAKLNSALTELFLDALLRLRIEREIESCAGDLRTVYERLALRAATAPRRTASGR